MKYNVILFWLFFMIIASSLFAQVDNSIIKDENYSISVVISGNISHLVGDKYSNSNSNIEIQTKTKSPMFNVGGGVNIDYIE